MAESHPTIKIHDQIQVSPPTGSIPTTTIPLTFLDIPWLLCRPMQRLFFYHLPYTTLHFAQTILPNLISSLSLTLQHFFPLASKLISPPTNNKPFILFTQGDSIPLTLAESTNVDFDRLISNYPRDALDLHPFVPTLPSSRVMHDGTRVVPLLAIQVTVFPESGVCIGVQFHHVAADGMAFHNFMKSWASVFRTGGQDLSQVPCLDRELVKDPRGFESIFLAEWWNWASVWDYDFLGSTNELLAHKVRATFVIGPTQIKRLKYFISSHMDIEVINAHLSTFVATCALVWVSIIKSREDGRGIDLVDKEKLCHFNFVADCRHRLNPVLPSNYFGNCLDICFVSVKKSELLKENGVVIAARAIGDKVKGLVSGVLKGAERWMLDWKEMSEQGGLVMVAGSPRLRVYDTDFGWGRPKKSELVQIDVSGAIYISESRDEEGGVEVGLALTRTAMEVFSSIFEECLKLILS